MKKRDELTEALDELRAVRLRIAARFDNDPAKLMAHLHDYHEQLLREGWVEAPPLDPEGTSRRC